MRGIDGDIEEAKFHAEGLAALISVLSHMPRPDPSILHTLSYALGLAHDRRDVLVMMKELLR